MVPFPEDRSSRRVVGQRTGEWVVPSFGVGLDPVAVLLVGREAPVPGDPPFVVLDRTGRVPVRSFLRLWVLVVQVPLLPFRRLLLLLL